MTMSSPALAPLLLLAVLVSPRLCSECVPALAAVSPVQHTWAPPSLPVSRLAFSSCFKVSPDWWTPGHVTQLAPLIGPVRADGPGAGVLAGRAQRGAAARVALHRGHDLQVSCDWRSPGHVTWVLASDWSTPQ